MLTPAITLVIFGIIQSRGPTFVTFQGRGITFTRALTAAVAPKRIQFQMAIESGLCDMLIAVTTKEFFSQTSPFSPMYQFAATIDNAATSGSAATHIHDLAYAVKYGLRNGLLLLYGDSYLSVSGNTVCTPHAP